MAQFESSDTEPFGGTAGDPTRDDLESPAPGRLARWRALWAMAQEISGCRMRRDDGAGDTARDPFGRAVLEAIAERLPEAFGPSPATESKYDWEWFLVESRPALELCVATAQAEGLRGTAAFAWHDATGCPVLPGLMAESERWVAFAEADAASLDRFDRSYAPPLRTALLGAVARASGPFFSAHERLELLDRLRDADARARRLDTEADWARTRALRMALVAECHDLADGLGWEAAMLSAPDPDLSKEERGLTPDPRAMLVEDLVRACILCLAGDDFRDAAAQARSREWMREGTRRHLADMAASDALIGQCDAQDRLDVPHPVFERLISDGTLPVAGHPIGRTWAFAASPWATAPDREALFECGDIERVKALLDSGAIERGEPWHAQTEEENAVEDDLDAIPPAIHLGSGRIVPGRWRDGAVVESGVSEAAARRRSDLLRAACSA